MLARVQAWLEEPFAGLSPEERQAGAMATRYGLVSGAFLVLGATLLAVWMGSLRPLAPMAINLPMAGATFALGRRGHAQGARWAACVFLALGSTILFLALPRSSVELFLASTLPMSFLWFPPRARRQWGVVALGLLGLYATMLQIGRAHV